MQTLPYTSANIKNFNYLQRFLQYFWHIAFISLFSVSMTKKQHLELLQSHPEQSSYRPACSWESRNAEQGTGGWAEMTAICHLAEVKGLFVAFFSLPILMNYKIEPKLTVRRTLSGPHTSEMLIGENLFQLFDLIKGSCFSIDFCALQSFPKQEPGSFSGTIWIPVRCQSLLKDNCLEGRSFWILIHSYNDEWWDLQPVLFSNLVPTKAILKGPNLPQNVHIWCLMTSEQWYKSIISAGGRRGEMCHPKFRKKIKHTELLYFWMQAVLKFSNCCMRHWIHPKIALNFMNNKSSHLSS